MRTNMYNSYFEFRFRRGDSFHFSFALHSNFLVACKNTFNLGRQMGGVQGMLYEIGIDKILLNTNTPSLNAAIKIVEYGFLT